MFLTAVKVNWIRGVRDDQGTVLWRLWRLWSRGEIKSELSGKTGIEEEDIETVECGSCEMEVTMDGETVFTEKKDFLDVGKVVEDIKSGLETRA